MQRIISVIVPVYNCEKYLERCVNSILRQTYPHFQLILVNDGSTDNSGIICDQFAIQDKRVQVIHQKNSGVSVARNRGLDVATGDFLYFVDSDDMIFANAFEIILHEFNNDIDAVFFGVIKKFTNGSTRKLPIKAGNYKYISILHGVLNDYASFGAGYPCNKVWRVSVFGDMKDVPRFDPQLYYFEDLEWNVRMLLRVTNINIIYKYLYQYTIREDSVTTKIDKKERRECGYHQSVWKIISDLQSENMIREWFAAKYYPELVNGVCFAWKHTYKYLKNMLVIRLVRWKNEILTDDSVDKRIKLRCKIILLLHTIHLL